MSRDPFGRRRRIKIVLGVLAVGIVVSVLVAVGLLYMGKMHPRY
jgi:hypothetical protein